MILPAWSVMVALYPKRFQVSTICARPAGIAGLNAKGQAAPVQPHHLDAALFKVKVLVHHEGEVLLDDNGVALQDNFLALRIGLKDGVAQQRLAPEAPSRNRSARMLSSGFLIDGKAPQRGCGWNCGACSHEKWIISCVFLYSKLSLPWSESMLACAWGAHGSAGLKLQVGLEGFDGARRRNHCPIGLNLRFAHQGHAVPVPSVGILGSRSVAFLSASAASSICPLFTMIAPKL